MIIIVGSTRPERIGIKVAEWVRERAEERGGFEIDFADLKEIDLPLLDEPKHPRLRDYQHEHTNRWSARVGNADAVVMVHPEYNFGVNAALKNAIDFLHHEWKHKPVGLISYGGVSAGQRAAQQLYPTLATLSMVTAGVVPIPFVKACITDDGELEPNGDMEEGLAEMLDQLTAYEEALRPLRQGTLQPA